MKKISWLLYILFFPVWSLAQSGNSLAFPSANNNFLGQVGGVASRSDADVDLYTGAAVVNVPVCSFVTKEMNIPVSLTYTGGRGIKVQDYAASVGLGWQLNAGGSLTRVVRGFPDELPNGYLGTGQWGKKVAAWGNGTAGLPNEVGSGSNTPTADGEPDLYYVKTPFFSFRFTFDENGEAVVSNANGVKVIPASFFNTTAYANASFRVIDDHGNQYFFGTTASSAEKSTCKFYDQTLTYTSTWYLDRILTYNGGDDVSLSYTTSGLNEVYIHYQSTATYGGNCSSPNIQVTDVTTTVIQPKYLAAITTSQGRIGFNYLFDRQDVINAGRLVSIEYGRTDWVLRTYDFNYSYFNSSSTDINLLRLRLDNITLKGSSRETSVPVPFKTFTYNTTEALPARNSKQFDFWGFNTLLQSCGGTTDPMIQPCVRQPNVTKAQAGILTGIKDITGGSWAFTYELNDYYSTTGAVTRTIGGLRVRQLAQTLPQGDNLVTTYGYTNDAGQSTGQVMTEYYSYLVAQGVMVFSEAPFNIYDINGINNGYSRVKVTSPNGGYTLYEFNNFSDFPDQYLGTDPSLAATMYSATSVAYKRGVLKRKVAVTAAGKNVSEEGYTYTSLTSPVTKKCWGSHPTGYSIGCGYNSSWSSRSQYSTLVENYRLTRLVKKDYDQLDDTKSIQIITDYAYASNKRLVKEITTYPSQSPNGSGEWHDYYYAEDAATPMVTTGQASAINLMLAANRTGVLIHESTMSGVRTTDIHHTYMANPAGGSNNKVYKISTDQYKNGTLVNQQFFTYDPNSSHVLSTSATGGKPISVGYGWNNSLAVAEVRNASTVYSLSSNGPQYTSEFFYEGFEENVPNTLWGGAHTGNQYYAGTSSSYTVNYTPPATNRSYILQWWSLENGRWVKNEEPYNGSRTFTGAVDDVRIFPVDALMTTYTFDPMIGKTGEIDPAGVTTTYEYDGLGRQKLVRDNDKNIISRTCYSFAGQATGCPDLVPVYVKLSYDNKSTLLARTVTGNVVLRFYADEACTVPLTVSDLPVSYIVNNDCGFSTPKQAVASGSVFVLEANAILTDQTLLSQPACNYTYELVPDDAFTIVPNPTNSNPQPLFAKLFYENVSTTGSTTTANIVVRFFSDAACTVPAAANSAPVTVRGTTVCGDGTSSLVTPTYITGTSGRVLTNAAIDYYGRAGGTICLNCPVTHCTRTYTINANPLYTVVP